MKYAIDKNWINEIGRVAIGVLSAGGLIGLAHKLRKDYKPFSSVLIGGGLALLYFTITVAFHSQGYPLYQQQTLAFIILILITVFAIFLSITYDRIEIAILAMLGGFASPMLISTGSGNYIVLFTYLMILNIGLLVLSYNKKWRLVNILAFAFTVLLFGSWLTSELLDSKYDTFNGAIFFATGFYVIFFLMNMVYNIKYKVNFKVGDISLLLSNTFIYFTFMMLMLNHIGDGQYKGLFSVLLGAFNFGFAYFIHYRKKADNNLLYLLIGLVFTFITLAIPLQLEGNYITLFWAIESVLLLWLSQKSGFTILKIGSLVVLLLMLISLIMDWENSYNYIALQTEDSIKTLTLIFNKMFLTTLVSVASLVAIFALLRNKEEDSKNWLVPNSLYRLIILGIAIIVFYIGGYLEANYQSLYYFAEFSSRNVLIITYNALFVTALLLYSTVRYNRNLAIITLVISTMFVLVFLFSLSSTFSESIRSYISGDEVLATTLLIMRWISVFAVYFISVLLFKLFRKINDNNTNEISKASTVFLVITVLYLLSSDLDSISILIAQSSDILIHTQKTGYAVLWGVSSFLLMIIGMKRKNKTLRVLSLILFAITLVKLFVYDISEISEGGKIVAFILLGILLLIVSFMYQKVKKLIVEDDFSITDEKEKTTISK